MGDGALHTNTVILAAEPTISMLLPKEHSGPRPTGKNENCAHLHLGFPLRSRSEPILAPGPSSLQPRVLS